MNNNKWNRLMDWFDEAAELFFESQNTKMLVHTFTCIVRCREYIVLVVRYVINKSK